MNVWRREVTNTARPCLAYTSLIRRDGFGWKWSIMCQTECLATGRGKTKLECLNAIRAGKAELNGAELPPPLAPTGKRGERL